MPLPKQAMVLAAGYGKRMRELTRFLPKPMIEVAGRTMIDRSLDNLLAAGVEKAVINTFYYADIIENYLRNRRFPKVIFSRETELLETGGGIARALHHFGGEAFFAVNSDVIWFEEEAPALRKLGAEWNDRLDALLLLHPIETAVGYEGKGDFFADAYGNTRRRGSAERAPYVYTGLQILHPRLFDKHPEGAFSLNLLYDKALHATPPTLKTALHEGVLLNVGDPEAKKLAEAHIVSMDSRAAKR